MVLFILACIVLGAVTGAIGGMGTALYLGRKADLAEDNANDFDLGNVRVIGYVVGGLVGAILGGCTAGNLGVFAGILAVLAAPSIGPALVAIVHGAIYVFNLVVFGLFYQAKNWSTALVDTVEKK